jgi:flagellar biosynthesis chaperone FliJ
MSFQEDKSHLESAFSALKQQISSTSENWNDSVQRRFYQQFLDSLPKEFLAYINNLDKLDKSFETAEKNLLQPE